MNSLKEIIDKQMTNYTGSERSRSMVEEQIRIKYGNAEVKNLDCYRNLRTFRSWLSLGYKVKKGEKCIKSVTFVEQTDDEGNITKKYKKPVSLFYYRQVEERGPENHEESD